MIQVIPTNEYEDGKRFFNASTIDIMTPKGHTIDDLYLLEHWIKYRIAIHQMFGEDKFTDGDILRFTGECTIPGTNLTYAAIKGGGRWWLTAVKPYNLGLTWKRLVAEFLTYALPDTIDICDDTDVRQFFTETKQNKLLELQYPTVEDPQ